MNFLKRNIILSHKRPFLNQLRTGYIVLVPEIGEKLSEHVVHSSSKNLPEFNHFSIENCIASIANQAILLEKEIDEIEKKISNDQPCDLFEEVFDPIERLYSPLETIWGQAKTLYLGNSSLMPTKTYLTIHNRARRAASIKFNSLTINDVVNRTDSALLDEEKSRFINKFKLESKLNGVFLNEKKKVILSDTLSRLYEKQKIFSKNVERATNSFQYTIYDENVMKEFPSSSLHYLSQNTTNPASGPWQVSLNFQSIQSFFEYCPNHDIKWNLWQASTRKASSQSDKSLANSSLLEEIRGLRQDQANILGYENFASMSMETKMIESVEKLENFLNVLLESARPSQEHDMGILIDFAEINGFQHQFEVYDVPYWRRRYLLDKIGYDENTFKEYFPSSNVVKGMFMIVEKLFGIKIVERKATSWSEHVKYYDVVDTHNCHEPVGGFYIDLFNHQEKHMDSGHNSGWMVGLRNRSEIANAKPLAALIFNFSAPLYGKPSLLSMREINTLFFKFGQALQHILTRARYSDVAGLSRMQWDVVEVTGYLMNFLLYDKRTLSLISSHYKDQQALPDTKIDAVLESLRFLSSYDLCKNIYKSMLDLHLHLSDKFWLDIVKVLYPLHFIFKLDKRDAHPCSFTQSISGEWAAAVFSHTHAKMVAADIYSAFEEAENKEHMGQRYKETFLYQGINAESFRTFRGRDPNPKALLKPFERRSV